MKYLHHFYSAGRVRRFFSGRGSWYISVVLHVFIVSLFVWEASQHALSTKMAGNTLAVSFMSEKTLHRQYAKVAQDIPVDVPGSGVPLASRYAVNEAGEKNREVVGNNQNNAKSKETSTRQRHSQIFDSKKTSKDSIGKNLPHNKVDSEKNDDPFDSVLKTISAAKERTRVVSEKTEKEKQFDQIMSQSLEGEPEDNQTGVLSHGVMSEDELDVLRRQIATCWHLPMSAIDAGDFSVTLSLTISQDKSVQNVKVSSNVSGDLTDAQNAIIQSALRAIYNPACHTLHLPDKKYDIWHQIDMTFKPSQMVG